jgi:long-chain acyl-CoA synthetase
MTANKPGRMIMTIKTPWISSYGQVPTHLDYPDLSMIDLIERNASAYPELLAYDFLGKTATYRVFLEKVHQCAKALRATGIQPGDKVTICMPNTPQGVIMFYALNMMGGIPNMVHPLSSEGEIEFYLNLSESKGMLVLDAFYPKVAAIRSKTPALEHIIVASIATELPFVKSLGFKATKGRKIAKIGKGEPVVKWTDFMVKASSWKGDYAAHNRGKDPAAILYSGGTSGITKGILLSNLNFNALAMQTEAAGETLRPGQKMLSIMPIFHGFGLGIGIHTFLAVGGCCHLIPQFSADSYAELLKTVQPNYIAGVPTLFEALLRNKRMDGVDLSCLIGVFSGGDTLSVELKKKVDAFLRNHNANIQLREGYGLTECVTASCLTPKDFYKEGTIGIPFPDTYYKIVKASTKNEVPYGDEGEICISGPTVMIGYLKSPAETESTLQQHEDGRLWLHTGDLGVMDEEGFIYFKQRLKRMIISSGYSIYPSQLENIIDGHEAVLMSSVIGVPDPYKMQKVKAFVVLKPEVPLTDEVRTSIYEHCKRNIAHYAMPYEFEYLDRLPQTLVGKVAYTVLEAQELAKVAAAQAN